MACTLRHFVNVHILCVVLITLSSSISSEEAVRIVKLRRDLNQNDRVFEEFRLLAGSAKSLVDCAKFCVQLNASASLTYWPTSTDPGQACVCYGILSPGLSSFVTAPGARCYSLEGRAPIECGHPPSILHAVPSATSGHVGSSVTYACAEGYNQTGSGSGQRVCELNEQWSALSNDTDPVCSPVECGPPPSLSNASPSSASRGYYGDHVTYTCMVGYTQSGGGGTRTCNSTGQWELEQTDITCTKTECGSPPDVAFATASPSTFGYYGDQVDYTCNHGYSQSGGTGSRVCSASGTWNLTDKELVCTRIECGFPPDVALATPSSSAVGHVGDVVTYACAAGYSHLGGGDGHRTCAESGVWDLSNQDPVCGTPCPSPPNVCGAQAVPVQARYVTGDVITYECTGSGDGGEQVSTGVTTRVSGSATPPTPSAVTTNTWVVGVTTRMSEFNHLCCDD